MLNIREHRKRVGFTQTQIAEKLGVRSNAVSQWETGVRSPSVKHLKQIAEMLGCTADDLLKPNNENQL